MTNPYCNDKIPDVNDMNPSHTLTRFERTRIIGLRATDISEGAPSSIKYGEKSIDVAQKEVDAEICPPVFIIRQFPDGEIVRVKYPRDKT